MGEFKLENRIFYLDMLRAFAIFCVLACHVFAFAVVKTEIFGTKSWYYSVVFNALRDIGVPIFVAISGSLLLNRTESLLKFTKKRITRVIIPYLFWAIMFIFFSILCNHFGLTFYKYNSLSQLFFNVFSINPQGFLSFFWFVPMIISVHVVIFIVNYINQFYENTLKFSLILSLIIIILFNIGFLLPKPEIYPFYFIFAVLGYYLFHIDLSNNNYLKRFNSKLPLIFLVLFVVFYSIEIFIDTSMSISLNHYYSVPHFSIINILSVLCIFLFFKSLSESQGKIKKIYEYLSSNNMGKIIFSISICSYGIYLSHNIVKFILTEFLIIPYFGYLNIPILATLILILTFIVSWLLIWALSKIPYVNILSGSG